MAQNINQASAKTGDGQHLEQTRTQWDSLADWYEKYDHFEIPQVVACAQYTDVPLKVGGAVLEVGCGTGLHSELLAKQFLAGQGATLVSCDISRAMILKMQQRYELSAFKADSANYVHIDTSTDYADVANSDRVNLEEVLGPQQKDVNKRVFGCIADNMRLPFHDGVFEAYISNLSLMIVQHRERQVQEAFRVLKSGSRACFTVQGRRENCLQQFIARALANLGRETPATNDNRFFELSENLPALKSMFEEAGFTDVRMWFQPGNWYYRDGADYWQALQRFIPDAHRDDQMKAEMIRLFEEAKPEMRSFEKLFILAHKA